MRIVHVLDKVRSHDADISRSTLELCVGLASRGHEVSVVASEVDELPEPLRCRAGFPRVEEIPPLTGPLKILSRWSRRYLQHLFSTTDVIHIHDTGQPGTAQIALFAARANIPCLTTSRPQGRRRATAFLGIGSRFRRPEIAPADTSLQAPLIDLSPFRKLPERSRARTAFPGDPSIPAVAFHGKLTPTSGIDQLLHAAALLIAEGKHLQVLISGSAEPPVLLALQNQIADLGLESSIAFLGDLDEAARVNILCAADVFVAPSPDSDHSLVPLHALACGTPVLATAATAFAPELHASGGALLLKSPSARAVAAALGELLQNRRRRKVMGQTGRAWVFDNLEPGSVLDAIEATYAQLIQSRPAAAGRLTASA